MAFGNSGKRKAPLGVFLMLAALVLAAFIGAAAGLIWQSAGWFADEPENEIVTANAPSD